MNVNLKNITFSFLLTITCLLVSVGFCLVPKVYSETNIKVSRVAGTSVVDPPLADTSMPDIILDSSLTDKVNLDISSIGIPDGTKVKIKFKDENNINPQEGVIQSGMATIGVTLEPGIPKVLYVETDAFISPPDSFSPKDIPGLKLWLKADDLNLEDGVAIESWNDSSGNGNNLNQLVPVEQRPVFKRNVIGSKPVVRFDGIDDHFVIIDNPDLRAGANSITVYFVTNPSNTPQRGIITNKVGTYPGWGIFVFDGTTNWQAGKKLALSHSGNFNNDIHSVVTTSDVIDGSFHYITGQIVYNDIDAWQVRKDGMAEAYSIFWNQSNWNPINDTNNQHIGHHSSTPIGSWHFSGDIAELLVYFEKHTPEQIQGIERYLKNKYSL